MTQPSTTTTNDATLRLVTSSVCQWALDELGLSAEARRDECHAELRRQLSVEGYCPNESWQMAFEIWQSMQQHDGQAPEAWIAAALPYLGQRESVARREVQQFAQVFFSLPCDERADRCTELQMAYADFPPLAAWLTELARGLDVDLSRLAAESRAVRDLARHLCSLFVTSPRERGLRRHQPPDEPLAATLAEWPAAAQFIAERYPELARLDTAYFNRLLNAKQEQLQRNVAQWRRAGYRQGAQVGKSIGWLFNGPATSQPRVKRVTGMSSLLAIGGAVAFWVAFTSFLMRIPARPDAPPVHRGTSTPYGNWSVGPSPTTSRHRQQPTEQFHRFYEQREQAERAKRTPGDLGNVPRSSPSAPRPSAPVAPRAGPTGFP